MPITNMVERTYQLRVYSLPQLYSRKLLQVLAVTCHSV